MDLSSIKLWTYEELVSNIESSFATEDEFVQSLTGYLKKTRPVGDEEHQITSKKLLSWYSENKSRVKVSSYDVPSGILGPKTNGALYDMKISCRGPDDSAYNKYEDLREKLPRGSSILFLHDLETQKISNDGIIFALRKFTGGMGDEDETQPDDNYVWLKYFLKPVNSAKKIVCTRKANGEAAHLSVRYLPKVGFVLCVGSKNVHMMVRNYSDVAKYTDQRFMVAKNVANAVLDLVYTQDSGLDESRLTLFLNFLHHTRFTTVFEILQPSYQHVVNLSYLGDKSELNLITFTGPYDESTSEESLCAINPEVVLTFARALGLKTVDFEVIEADQAELRMESVRMDYGHEGEVFYFLDSKGRVIGLLKKKTAWYVLCRAIRKKAAAASAELKKNGVENGFLPKKWESRIDQIQKWLGFPDKYKTAWLALGTGFLLWLRAQLKEGMPPRQQRDLNVRGNFPVIWQKYLTEKNLTDKIEWS